MKRKSAILAVLLNYISIGLGQIYAGRFRRGVRFIAVSLILCLAAFTLIISRSALSVYLLYGLFVIVLAFATFVLLDAYRCARRFNIDNDTVKNRFNSAYIVLILIFIVIDIVINPFDLSDFIIERYVQLFKVPSAAMEPAIIPGDFIVVEKRGYKNKIPERGEITVFVYPSDTTKSFLKRCVAVPGDTLEMRDRVLYINSVSQNEPYVHHIDSVVRRDENRFYGVQKFFWQNEYLVDDLTKQPGNNYRPTRDNFGPLIVPESKYFCLGDNREYSADSRFWGFVHKRLTIGRPLKIYWPPGRVRLIE